jgi:periplasmic protein TonB
MSKIVSVVLACVFAFVLFAVMNLLIEQKVNAQPQKTTQIKLIEPAKLDELTVKPRPPKKEKLPELTHQEQPKSITPLPPRKVAKVPPKTTIKPALGDSLPDLIGTRTEGSSGFPHGISGGGAPLAPRVRIAPMYPIDAAKENIQGYAKVQFDISEAGRPFNIRVIESQPKGFFERSSRKAVAKWRYNPQLDDGKATVVRDQIVTLDYKLESEA